MITSVLTF